MLGSGTAGSSVVGESGTTGWLDDSGSGLTGSTGGSGPCENEGCGGNILG